MTEPFVSQLRARGDALQLAGDAANAITVRVEVPEVWDTVKAVISPSDSVAMLKSKALEALYPFGAPADFVLKLRGFEVLNENATIEEAGAKDGSIFLLTHRRGRAVR